MTSKIQGLPHLNKMLKQPEILHQSHRGSMLLSLAALVIVLAAIKMAKDLMVPLLMAGFMAIICMPLLQVLIRRGVSSGWAVLLTMVSIVIALLGTGLLLGSSIADFSSRLPVYQDNLQHQMQGLLHWLDSMGISMSGGFLADVLDPSSAMKLAGNLLSAFGNILTNSFFILLTVIFLLFEFIAIPHKWALIAEHAPDTSHLHAFLESVNRYLAMKTGISLMTGLSVGLLTWGFGLDYPVLWGFLAFLFNFVPNIGSIIAAVPALLLAVIQLGVGDAALIGVGYIIINVLFGNVIEPRLLGRGVGLSTLVVFLSLVFWGWLLGPVGMLLSIPLTMIVKLALEADPEKRWIAVLLGPDVD